jgi:magnesium transporter
VSPFDSKNTPLPQGPVCRIYSGGGGYSELSDLSRISEILVEPDSFVWLDAVDPDAGDLDLIKEEFGLHPLAIEDAVKAHQRPKIEAYDSYWFVVVHPVTKSAGGELTIHELAIFAGAKFIITVRESPPFPLEEIERRWHGPHDGLPSDSGALLYTILDTVVDGYLPVAEAFEERVDELEEALFEDRQRKSDVLLEIFRMKKDVQQFRRSVVPMRDLLAPIIRGDLKLFAPGEIAYYRDVYDHAVRAIEQMDAARDLVTSALDVQISIASSRQNEVSKQLTIIATIFLPLSYITGFFGQNFGFLVDRVAGAPAFLLGGVVLQVVSFLALLAYFRFKRWF